MSASVPKEQPLLSLKLNVLCSVNFQDKMRLRKRQYTKKTWRGDTQHTHNPRGNQKDQKGEMEAGEGKGPTRKHCRRNECQCQESAKMKGWDPRKRERTGGNQIEKQDGHVELEREKMKQLIILRWDFVGGARLLPGAGHANLFVLGSGRWWRPVFHRLSESRSL